MPVALFRQSFSEYAWIGGRTGQEPASAARSERLAVDSIHLLRVEERTDSDCLRQHCRCLDLRRGRGGNGRRSVRLSI